MDKGSGWIASAKDAFLAQGGRGLIDRGKRWRIVAARDRADEDPGARSPRHVSDEPSHALAAAVGAAAGLGADHGAFWPRRGEGMLAGGVDHGAFRLLDQLPDD